MNLTATAVALALGLGVALTACSGEASADTKALRPCRTYDQVSEDWNRGDLTLRQLAGRLQEVNDQAKGTSVEDEAQALVDSTIVGGGEFTRADRNMAAACDKIDG